MSDIKKAVVKTPAPDWITKMYRDQIKSCLMDLKSTPAKGYWSTALGVRIDGQREVLKRLQSINATFKALAAVHKLDMTLYDAPVPEADPFEDALADIG
jgi:hypothetical protein